MTKVDAPILPQCDDMLYMHVKDGGSEQPGTPQVSDDSHWMGLAINGPKYVTLDPNVSGTYHAIIAGLCTLPGDWSKAEERLQLIFEDLETGKKSTNSVESLSQINGISISPAYEAPSKAPYLTPELLAKAPRNYMSSSYPNPNFSLLGFPSGTHKYKVYMALDGLCSNEIEITITN